MDLNLKNKVVVLSGGAGISGSIGETILQALASEGAIPAIIDRNAGMSMPPSCKQKESMRFS